MIQLYLSISCLTILLHFSYETLLRRRKWAPQVLASQIYSLVFFGGEMPKQSSVEEKQLRDIHPVGVEAGRRRYWSDTMEVLEVGILSPTEIAPRSFFRDTNCVVSNPTCLTSWVRGDRLLFSQSVLTCLASYVFADFHSLPRTPWCKSFISLPEEKMKKPSGSGLGFRLAMNRIEVFIHPTLGKFS